MNKRWIDLLLPFMKIIIKPKCLLTIKGHGIHGLDLTNFKKSIISFVFLLIIDSFYSENNVYFLGHDQENEIIFICFPEISFNSRKCVFGKSFIVLIFLLTQMNINLNIL